MRRMRQDFSKIYSFASSSQISSNVASIVRANENALNLTLQNYYRDTKRGANLTEVNRWSGDVFAQLKELESFKADTAFAP